MIGARTLVKETHSALFAVRVKTEAIESCGRFGHFSASDLGQPNRPICQGFSSVSGSGNSSSTEDDLKLSPSANK